MGRWKENDELNHARVKLSTGSELNFPTFKVTVVALVARVSDPQIVSAKSGLVFHPGEDAIIFSAHFCHSYHFLVVFRHFVFIFACQQLRKFKDDVDERRRGEGLAWTMTFGPTGIMRARHLFCHRPPLLHTAFTLDCTPLSTLPYTIHF